MRDVLGEDYSLVAKSALYRCLDKVCHTKPRCSATRGRYGQSCDKRSDCVRVVIALIVMPEGFPLTYEVLLGNTADNTTLRGFRQKIENEYGKAQRIWVMDRGIRQTRCWQRCGNPIRRSHI